MVAQLAEAVTAGRVTCLACVVLQYFQDVDRHWAVGCRAYSDPTQFAVKRRILFVRSYEAFASVCFEPSI